MTKASVTNTQTPELLVTVEDDLTIIEVIQIMLNTWSRDSGMQSKVDLQLGPERILLKSES
jgi:hypothetical protein